MGDNFKSNINYDPGASLLLSGRIIIQFGAGGGQWWPVVANSGRHRDDRLDRKVEETWKFPQKGLDKIVKGTPEKSPLHKKGNGNLLWQVFVSAILDKMLPDPLAP